MKFLESTRLGCFLFFMFHDILWGEPERVHPFQVVL